MKNTDKSNRDEINPENQMTQFVRDQWHKIAALIMMKQELDEISFGSEDISLLALKNVAVMIEEKDERIFVRLKPMDEAVAYARAKGFLVD